MALIIGGFFALSGVVGGLIIYFYFFYKKSTMSIYDFEDNGKGKVGGEGPTMTKIKIQNEI